MESRLFATVRDLARAEKINEVYLCRVLRLTLLSPGIAEAILSGLIASTSQAAETFSDRMGKAGGALPALRFAASKNSAALPRQRFANEIYGRSRAMTNPTHSHMARPERYGTADRKPLFSLRNFYSRR
jgi:hypothetical protein